MQKFAPDTNLFRNVDNVPFVLHMHKLNRQPSDGHDATVYTRISRL